MVGQSIGPSFGLLVGSSVHQLVSWCVGWVGLLVRQLVVGHLFIGLVGWLVGGSVGRSSLVYFCKVTSEVNFIQCLQKQTKN